MVAAETPRAWPAVDHDGALDHEDAAEDGTKKLTTAVLRYVPYREVDGCGYGTNQPAMMAISPEDAIMPWMPA